MMNKLAFLIFSIIFVGLPFDTVWHYFYAFIISIFLIYGVSKKTYKSSYLIFSIMLFLVSFFVPKIEIIEQQRLLIDQGKYISPEVFIKNINSYEFAQTADGYVQKLKNSRKVRNIFLTHETRCLRSGYVNKPEYNYYGEHFAFNRVSMPFVVCYEVNEQIIKRGLKAQGLFFFNNQFFENKSVQNINFTNSDLGKHFYAFSTTEEKNSNLILKLNKTSADKYLLLCEVVLKTLAIFIFANFLFSFSNAKFDKKEVFIILSWLMYCVLFYGKFLWQTFVTPGGYDGVVHDGFPYLMLESLNNNDWLSAIKSPESTFYYMPGFRYVRFVEMLIFGDSMPIQAMLIMFTPLIYFRFFKILVSAKYSLIIVICMALGLTDFLGRSLGLDFRFSLESFFIIYGEGLAYACLIGAATILLNKNSTKFSRMICFALFALSISIRPNFLIFVAWCSLMYFLFPVFSIEDRKNRILDLAPLAILILIPLHNIYFGNEFVLLTKASTIKENMPITIGMWKNAIMSLGGVVVPFNFEQNFSKQFGLNGLPMAFFIMSNFLIAMYFKITSKIGVIALACCFSLCMHLFYLADMRYMHPYFTISIGMLMYFLRNIYFTKIKKIECQI